MSLVLPHEQVVHQFWDLAGPVELFLNVSPLAGEPREGLGHSEGGVRATACSRHGLRRPHAPATRRGSLKRLGKHLTINHSKNMVDKRTKNHINGIEGFWSFAKHILYNYRGVSKYHFPMYLKEVEYRFNHRNENLFKLFLSIYFGYVSH